jgi:aspartyl protease family protein
MRLLLACAALAACGAAFAQSVALQGMMGNRALLIVDGHAPKMVAPGDTYEGVKVVSTSGEQAVVEINGQRHTLRVGDAPASVGNSAPRAGTGTQIVLPAGTGGHFYSEGLINGKPVNFIVDTGATFIALSMLEAQRLGIDYRTKGQQGRMGTANGSVTVWRVKLDSVRVGEVELFGVDAVLVPSDLPYVLLGNSFLSRFQITQGAGRMVLERRY